MIPQANTTIVLENELAGARAWAARHGIPVCWLPANLQLRVTLTQLQTNERFYLRGIFDNYRELPPAWVFTDAAWLADAHPRLFPRPAQSPYGASVLHSNAVICAPFNRLAYADYQGPHSDWGGPANWLTAGRPTEVKANLVGDMLQIIFRDFIYSRGRLA